MDARQLDRLLKTGISSLALFRTLHFKPQGPAALEAAQVFWLVRTRYLAAQLLPRGARPIAVSSVLGGQVEIGRLCRVALEGEVKKGRDEMLVDHAHPLGPPDGFGEEFERLEIALIGDGNGIACDIVVRLAVDQQATVGAFQIVKNPGDALFEVNDVIMIASDHQDRCFDLGERLCIPDAVVRLPTPRGNRGQCFDPGCDRRVAREQ
jgi:hypothetical protein